MKKRIISLLLVALMLVSIAPFGAMAAGNTVITEQPSDVSVNAGETATFSIAATNPNSTDLKYLWFDADEINTNNISLKDLRDTIDKAKLGEEQVLTLTDVQQSMSIRCAVYYESEKTILGHTVPTDLVFSKTVKLTVIGGVTPSPDPSTSPDPSDSPTPSPSTSVDPASCTHAKPEYHPESNNTCDPHIEYWYCPDCKTYFTDAACTNEIRKSKLDDGMTKDKNKHTALKKVPSKAATCTEEGNIEHWYCSGCDNYYTDENATVKTSHAKVTTKKADHDYYWVADEVANVHYEKCRVCGKTSGTSNHSGGTASCKAQAKCEKCGASYGELDATNHVKFEYKNAVKPTETTKGYTGDKYCADCGAFIEQGKECSAQCTGGCKDLKLVKGTPKTCTADGTIDYYKCPKCHNIYRDEKGTTSSISAPATTCTPALIFSAISI